MRVSLACIVAMSVIAACAPAPAANTAAADNSSAVISEAIGSGLQGNAAHAVALLQPLNAVTLTEEDAAYRACMLSRFSADAPAPAASNASLSHQLISLYQQYWFEALRNPPALQSAEARLEAGRSELAGVSPNDPDIDPQDVLRARLSETGQGVLFGRTGVLLELILWDKERRQTFHVELPGKAYDTPVALLDNFESLGWGDYATCGQRGVGGWTADNTLFAVVPRYDGLDTEDFSVTFLGHETQHFADNQDFPDLQAWELEYRAKLAELALSDKTRDDILTRFREDRGDDTASPHSYANTHVLAALRTRLGVNSDEALSAVDLTSLHAAAVAELAADTEARQQPD